jgi:hypothetical protein
MCQIPGKRINAWWGLKMEKKSRKVDKTTQYLICKLCVYSCWVAITQNLIDCSLSYVTLNYRTSLLLSHWHSLHPGILVLCSGTWWTSLPTAACKHELCMLWSCHNIWKPVIMTRCSKVRILSLPTWEYVNFTRCVALHFNIALDEPSFIERTTGHYAMWTEGKLAQGLKGIMSKQSPSSRA